MDKLPDLLKALAALLWPVATFALLYVYRAPIRHALDAIIASLRRGASIELFSFKLQGPLIRDPGVGPSGPDLFSREGFELRPASEEDYEARNALRRNSRFVRLVHRVAASGRDDFPYDVSVYLKVEEFLPRYTMDAGAARARLNDIDRVEYYFGHFFGEGERGSWFVVEDCATRYAVRFVTADEVTCVARIHFHDGQVATVQRYLDLEMGSTVRELGQVTTTS